MNKPDRSEWSRRAGLTLVIFVVLYLAVDPLPGWESVTPQQADMDESILQQAWDYALVGGGSGCIIRGKVLVL